MKRAIGLCLLLGLFACAPAEGEDTAPEVQTDDVTAAKPRKILECTGDVGPARVEMEITEAGSARTPVLDVVHNATVRITKSGQTTSFQAGILGDPRRLGINRRHMYFESHEGTAFRLTEGFRKKADTNIFRGSFIFTAGAIDGTVECKKAAESAFLF